MFSESIDVTDLFVPIFQNGRKESLLPSVRQPSVCAIISLCFGFIPIILRSPTPVQCCQSIFVKSCEPGATLFDKLRLVPVTLFLARVSARPKMLDQ